MAMVRTKPALQKPARSQHSVPSLGRWCTILALAAAAALSACSTEHYLVNRKLQGPKAEQAYAMRNHPAQGNSDSLFVVLAISGGGYRAAALGYGVLAALRETPIVWEGRKRSMLDEVDVITGVSGGSLVAAHYLAFREQTFQRFEPDVLGFDLQGALLSRTISPRGLWRQTSPRFGRSDLLQEVLDERIFAGKTFGDVVRQRPMGVINATDLEFGGRFEFTQDQFDHLCSDLDSMPLARAVAASMAVPLVLSPVTVWNQREACPFSATGLDLKSQVARSRFIHLLDGGLADNTGVQTPLELISVRGGIIRSAVAAGLKGIRKRVFIIVNAQGRTTFPEDASPDTPTLLRQLLAVVDVPIDRYSAASIDLLKREVLGWREDLRLAGDQQLDGVIARDTDFYVIEVSLAAPPPGVDVSTLSAIPTALRLDPAASQALQQYARTALSRNPEWLRLLGALRAQPD